MGYTTLTRTPYPINSALVELRSFRVEAPHTRLVEALERVGRAPSFSGGGGGGGGGGSGGGQGLTLFHFSAQPEPDLTPHTP
jgi:hypothetical protein